jgi:hypothetical protein
MSGGWPMRLLVLAVFVSILTASVTTHAATITDIFTFTATGYGEPTVTGSFTLTFDPTASYTDATSGLIVNSFSYSFPSPVATAFDYYPSEGGAIYFGGTANGGVNGTSNGTNDFFLELNTISGQFMQFALYSTPRPKLFLLRRSSWNCNCDCYRNFNTEAL